MAAAITKAALSSSSSPGLPSSAKDYVFIQQMGPTTRSGLLPIHEYHGGVYHVRLKDSSLLPSNFKQNDFAMKIMYSRDTVDKQSLQRFDRGLREPGMRLCKYTSISNLLLIPFVVNSNGLETIGCSSKYYSCLSLFY
jgi:hypothetical protein